MKTMIKLSGHGSCSITMLDGKMSRGAQRALKNLSRILELDEAKTVEWALNRCGLRIKTPSKFYPEG